MPSYAAQYTRNPLTPRCTGIDRPPVTAQVASSSLVVPAIPSKRVARISLKSWRAKKGPFSYLFARPFVLCSAQNSEISACKCIYTAVYISGRQIMAVARVFKSGNSQAVRLPKKFRVKSSEVEIFRRGDEIVLREKAGGMVRVLDLLAELPADMFPKKRKDPHPQRRKGL